PATQLNDMTEMKMASRIKYGVTLKNSPKVPGWLCHRTRSPGSSTPLTASSTLPSPIEYIQRFYAHTTSNPCSQAVILWIDGHHWRRFSKAPQRDQRPLSGAINSGLNGRRSSQAAIDSGGGDDKIALSYMPRRCEPLSALSHRQPADFPA